jgi:hypothetical protein
MKRSSQVALLLMGTVAVGGGAFALMPSEKCQPNQPGLAQPSGQQNCGSSYRGNASSGGSYGRPSSSSSSSSQYLSSRQGFAGNGSSSSSTSNSVARGGFGSFSSHFSGGG